MENETPQAKSFNQRALEVRVVSTKDQWGNNMLRVAYPKTLCRKDTAWQHLLRKPPKESGIKRNAIGKEFNPWRTDHDSENWAWVIENDYTLFG